MLKAYMTSDWLHKVRYKIRALKSYAKVCMGLSMLQLGNYAKPWLAEVLSDSQAGACLFCKLLPHYTILVCPLTTPSPDLSLPVSPAGYTSLAHIIIACLLDELWLE